MTTRYIYDIPNTDPMGWLDIRFKRVSSSLVGLYDASSVLKSLTCQGLTLGNSSVLSHTDGYNYLRGDVTSFQDAGGTTRSAIYPTVGRQTWTFGTSYAQIDAGAAGINTHASLALVTSMGTTHLFNWHSDGVSYLDASSVFKLRTAGSVRLNITAEGNVDVTGTLSAAVFEPNYLRIPGTNAVTGTYVLATVGDNSIGFSGANDANSSHLIEHRACSYQVNGGSIVTYPGVRYGMQKEGTWNLGGGGTQIGAAFIVETSSGGSLSSLPTMTQRLRIGSDGKATFTVTGNATRSIGALFQNTSDIVGAGNDYENEVHLVLQAGTSANHRRYIDWKNYNGTDAYLAGVNAGGAFILYDSAQGHRILMQPNGTTQLNSFGAYAVEINSYGGPDTLGTGGLAVYSGGSPVGRKKIFTVGESASSDVRLDGRFFWGGSLNNEVGRMTYSGIDAYIDAFQDGGALYLRSNVGGIPTQAAKITAGEVYINATIRAINNVEIYGTAGANKLAVWNNISKDYLRFAIDSNTGEATFSGGSRQFSR